nr:MAG TPA: Structural protein [Crassvirales sp.]
MATFSTNQVRQLYVAKTLKTPRVPATDTAGSIAVKSDTAKNHLYFEYKGADNLMRSDLIDIKNILYAKATDADDMAHELRAVTVTLDSEVNAAPVAGQDYILRIAFKQYVGMSDEDQYFKYGMVHAYAGMTASDFYKKLALSLAKNFSREIVPLVKFILTSSKDEAVPVDATTKESSLTGTYKALVIDEVEQPWRLGIMEQTPVYFEVQPVPVTVNGDERIWGKVEETDPAGTIANGKKIADLEYFCMGERGDMYRGVGYPNNIPTTYLVDPTVKYNVIDIHYAYVGSNESVQKSEKTITLVVPKVGATNSVSNKLANDIIKAINTATGLSIATLSEAAG